MFESLWLLAFYADLCRFLICHTALLRPFAPSACGILLIRLRTPLCRFAFRKSSPLYSSSSTYRTLIVKLAVWIMKCFLRLRSRDASKFAMGSVRNPIRRSLSNGSNYLIWHQPNLTYFCFLKVSTEHLQISLCLTLTCKTCFDPVDNFVSICPQKLSVTKSYCGFRLFDLVAQVSLDLKDHSSVVSLGQF